MSKSISFEMLREDWRTVFHYTKNNRFIALIFILNGLYMVCLTSIDSLEAAFSMNTLQLDESTYGLLVSVAGIGFVIGSIVNIKWAIPPLIAIKWGMVCTAIGYSIYSFSTSWGMAAVGFFVVSGALTFVNVGYVTFIQKKLTTELLGRFMSIFSLIEAFGMIVMIGTFAVMTEIVTLRSLVKSGVVFLIFIVVTFFISEKRSKGLR